MFCYISKHYYFSFYFTISIHIFLKDPLVFLVILSHHLITFLFPLITQTTLTPYLPKQISFFPKQVLVVKKQSLWPFCSAQRERERGLFLSDRVHNLTGWHKNEKVLKFTGDAFMICYRLCRYMRCIGVVLVVLVQEPLHVYGMAELCFRVWCFIFSVLVFIFLDLFTHLTMRDNLLLNIIKFNLY